MADRTSAEIFGHIFEHLAKVPTNDNKTLARWLIKLSERYDFSRCQMECDEALVALGIAKRPKKSNAR